MMLGAKGYVTLQYMHTAPPSSFTKDAWRKWAQQARTQHVTPENTQAIIQHLLQTPVFTQATRVLSYLPFGNEVNVAPLHQALLEQSPRTHILFTTRTHFKPVPHLTVHPLESPLECHRFGYLQPVADAPIIDPASMDIVLMPGLVFDRRGGRLGYGMGFYDRLLPLIGLDTPRLALAPSALVVPELPYDTYDIFMTHLVTEQGVMVVD